MLHAAIAGLLGTAMLLALFGWGIARSLLKLATLNRSAVLACALALTIVGVYSMRQSLFDVLVMMICGFVGYFMLRYGYSTAAAAIALVLGDGAERSLRTGLNLTGNDWWAFLTRPITGSILLIALLIPGLWHLGHDPPGAARAPGRPPLRTQENPLDDRHPHSQRRRSQGRPVPGRRAVQRRDRPAAHDRAQRPVR